MEDRIAAASRAVKSRLRKASREHSQALDLKWDYDGTIEPRAAPSDLWDGIDATPVEVLGEMMNQWRAVNQEKAALLRAAATGLGANMAMHDTNSKLSSLGYGIRSALAEADEGSKLRSSLDRAHETVGDISRAFGFLSGLAGDYGPELTGKVVMEGLSQEFYWLRQERYSGYKLEATDAFLKARVSLSRDVGLATYVNLVRNALQWIKDEGTVRLDTWEVQTPPYDPESEDEDDRKPGKARLFSVEDSGPGIPEAKRASVFTPFASGRRSSGIGLHICRTMLARSHLGIRADEGTDLGGARFVFGPAKVVDPLPPPLEHDRGIVACGRGPPCAAGQHRHLGRDPGRAAANRGGGTARPDRRRAGGRRRRAVGPRRGNARPGGCRLAGRPVRLAEAQTVKAARTRKTAERRLTPPPRLRIQERRRAFAPPKDQVDVRPVTLPTVQPVELAELGCLVVGSTRTLFLTL
jgi:hypothetical protein